MAITYLLAPEPFWVIINNEGTVAGGAQMFTRRSLNKIQDKIVYMDPAGTIPWTNPIIFDLNGVQGPFYWSVDSSNLNETYYIFVNDADGNLIWDIDNFAPPGSGGGGNVNTFIPITNYIANNQFIDHIDATVTTNTTNLVIAPSNHQGFTPALINPVIGTNGALGPDIRFVKNSTANTDQLSFPTFPLASAPLTGDVTPVDYVRYQCTTGNPGETFKAFQFPITQKVKNLSNQAMSFNIWAATQTGTATVQVYLRQYFGSGTAASAEVLTPIGASINLTTTWTRSLIQFSVPDVAGKSLGTPGQQTDDDAVYIQFGMPLNTPCDVIFTKPALYIGTINPNLDFQNYDQINSVNSTPRTGDIRTSLSSSAPNGWVLMNDGSIGNVGSGASTRANQDTFQLYKTIWDGVIDTWAPVSTGRGGSAVADFIAGKTLTLPRSLGRALAGAGSGSGLTARALGQFVGSEIISIAAMPAHSHPPLAPMTTFWGDGTGNTVQGGAGIIGKANATGSTGGSAADGNMEPTSFFNVFIKL
jgi:hypothetical protein